MTEQSEAQRLADELDAYHTASHHKKAAAELRRLNQHELANNVWNRKTKWVQDTVQPHELGMHRADVLLQRIDRMEEVNARLLGALIVMVDNFGPTSSDVVRGLGEARAAIAAAKEQS
jgi:ATP-dependent exoDNAse (exonuclease V) beta subunit